MRQISNGVLSPVSGADFPAVPTGPALFAAVDITVTLAGVLS